MCNYRSQLWLCEESVYGFAAPSFLEHPLSISSHTGSPEPHPLSLPASAGGLSSPWFVITVFLLLHFSHMALLFNVLHPLNIGMVGSSYLLRFIQVFAIILSQIATPVTITTQCFFIFIVNIEIYNHLFIYCQFLPLEYKLYEKRNLVWNDHRQLYPQPTIDSSMKNYYWRFSWLYTFIVSI